MQASLRASQLWRSARISTSPSIKHACRLVHSRAVDLAKSTPTAGPNSEASVVVGDAAKLRTFAQGDASADLLLADPDGDVLEEQQQAPAPQLVEVEVETEELVEEQQVSLVERARSLVLGTNVGKVALVAGAGLLLVTLGIAIKRVLDKTNTPRAKRLRQIDRNRSLVEGLNEYLPSNRSGLNAGVIRRLRGQTSFTTTEMFRKYLWYLLRERKFDQGAVEDMVALKHALGLSDADVGDALRERGQRMYVKYGTLMLNTEGMTLEGTQRKATCTALFRKLLYLVECAELVAPDSGGAQVADLRKIFGATEEDLDKLRIRSLYEAEVDLEAAFAAEDDMHEDDGPGSQPRTTPPHPPPGKA